MQRIYKVWNSKQIILINYGKDRKDLLLGTKLWIVMVPEIKE